MGGADRSCVAGLCLACDGRKGMYKMKNDILRKQFSEAEPVRRREAELVGQRDLARQTTLVVSFTSITRCPSLSFTLIVCLALHLCCRTNLSLASSGTQRRCSQHRSSRPASIRQSHPRRPRLRSCSRRNLLVQGRILGRRRTRSRRQRGRLSSCESGRRRRGNDSSGQLACLERSRGEAGSGS